MKFWVKINAQNFRKCIIYVNFYAIFYFVSKLGADHTNMEYELKIEFIKFQAKINSQTFRKWIFISVMLISILNLHTNWMATLYTDLTAPWPLWPFIQKFAPTKISCYMVYVSTMLLGDWFWMKVGETFVLRSLCIRDIHQ